MSRAPHLLRQFTPLSMLDDMLQRDVPAAPQRRGLTPQQATTKKNVRALLSAERAGSQQPGALPDFVHSASLALSGPGTPEPELGPSTDRLLREFDRFQKYKYTTSAFGRLLRAGCLDEVDLPDDRLEAYLGGESFLRHHLPDEDPNFVNYGVQLTALNELTNLSFGSLAAVCEKIYACSGQLSHLKELNMGVAGRIGVLNGEILSRMTGEVAGARDFGESAGRLLHAATSRANLRNLRLYAGVVSELSRTVAGMENAVRQIKAGGPDGDTDLEDRLAQLDSQAASAVDRLPGAGDLLIVQNLLIQRAALMNSVRNVSAASLSAHVADYLIADASAALAGAPASADPAAFAEALRHADTAATCRGVPAGLLVKLCKVCGYAQDSRMEIGGAAFVDTLWRRCREFLERGQDAEPGPEPGEEEGAPPPIAPGLFVMNLAELRPAIRWRDLGRSVAAFLTAAPHLASESLRPVRPAERR